MEGSPVKSLHDHIQWWKYINNNAREGDKHAHYKQYTMRKQTAEGVNPDFVS